MDLFFERSEFEPPVCGFYREWSCKRIFEFNQYIQKCAQLYNMLYDCIWDHPTYFELVSTRYSIESSGTELNPVFENWNFGFPLYDDAFQKVCSVTNLKLPDISLRFFFFVAHLSFGSRQKTF